MSAVYANPPEKKEDMERQIEEVTEVFRRARADVIAEAEKDPYADAEDDADVIADDEAFVGYEWWKR